jgi:hypothetical protein
VKSPPPDNTIDTPGKNTSSIQKHGEKIWDYSPAEKNPVLPGKITKPIYGSFE